MTADIELLPLPTSWDCWIVIKMEEYARANVEHHTAAKDAEIERLRAEVERLQEVVRPKREDECLTLDHWRMRAYALEANWSRCSHACAVEQDKREQAEARAERLAEALREARAMVEDWAGYASEYFQDKHDLQGDLAKLDAALRDHGQGSSP